MKSYHNIFLLSVDLSVFPFQEFITHTKKPEAKLLPLGTKLERTLRNLKKVRSDESVVMAEQQETHQNIPALAIERP